MSKTFLIRLRCHTGYHLIIVRLTFLTHSVRMKPNFQGQLWIEFDELCEDELLIRLLMG